MKKKKPYKTVLIGSLRNYLRKLWLHSPIRAEALKRDAVYEFKTKKDGTKYKKATCIGYKCFFCGELIEKKDECVHHKRNLPPFDLENLWSYIKELLFPDLTDLATAHKTCHKKHHEENGNKFIENA